MDAGDWIALVGIMLALFLAWYGNPADREQRKRDRRAQARSLAHVVLPHFEWLHTRHSILVRQVDEGETGTVSSHVRLRSPIEDAHSYKQIDEWTEVPIKLREIAKDLHLLDTAADAAQTALYSATEAHGIASDLVLDEQWHGGATSETYDSATKAVRRAASDCAIAAKEIRGLLESPKG